MSDVATYSAVHSLQDGRAIRIRALKPEDRSGLLEAVRRSSPQSLYRRFFGLKRYFSEEEVAYFVRRSVEARPGIAPAFVEICLAGLTG